MATKFLNIAVKGSGAVIRRVEREKRKKDKALQTAIKVESFRLQRVIRQGIRTASPGGQRLEAKTAIARRRNGRFENKKPFRGMASSVRYDFDPLKNEARIGWTNRSAARLLWLAERYQEGFETKVTPGMRRLFARRGAELSKQSRLRKYFFLSKETKWMETPERQIIEPVFKSERGRIGRNIAKNFRLKMAGQRI